jgi:hypothetical protein
MKAAEISKLLDALAALAADDQARTAVQDISELFSKAGTQTVAAVCKRLASMENAAEGAPANGWPTDTLASYLIQFEALLLIAGAKKASDDVKSIAAILRVNASWSVRAWVQSADAALAAKTSRAKSASKKAPATAVDADTIVQDYLLRFTNAGWDVSAFETVIDELAKDRAVSPVIARTIGERLTHLNTTKLGKVKVIAAMRRDFTDRLRTRNELNVVAKTKPW